MAKIIIHIEDGIDPILAMTQVLVVMSMGKISKAAGIDHYCWATKVNQNAVFTKRKKTANGPDSFVVCNAEPQFLRMDT